MFSFFDNQKRFLKLGIAYFGIPFLMILLGRLTFFFYYYKEYRSSYPLIDLFFNLVHGIRFDLAVVFLVYGTFYLLVLLCPARWQFGVLKVLFIASSLVTLSFVFLIIADLDYFGESGRHLSFEILFLLSDLQAILLIVWQNHKLLLLFGFLLLGLLIYSWIFFYKIVAVTKNGVKNYLQTKFSWKLLFKETALRITIFFIIVLLARGGWQLKPLDVPHAFLKGDQKLGDLALSSPFNFTKFLVSGISIIKPKNWIDKKEASKYTQALLSNKLQEETFLNPEFPLYRHLNLTSSPNKLNLVIIMMESWGGRFIDVLSGNNPQTTPNFNNLSKKSLLFTNFYSTGRRSVLGISSTLFGLPNNERLPFYKSPLISNKMTGLAQVLNKENYQTLFLHAGHEGSLNLHNLSKVAGYQKVISIDNIADSKTKYDGTWGLWDHHSFDLLTAELNQLKQPFHSLFFSLSSHDPYNVPSKNFNYFKPDIPDYKFLNSLRYSDWALGEFFKKAEKSDWYKNTIFIITADHSRGITNKIKEDFQIPLLIFSPNSTIKAGIAKQIGSQIDILPTALFLLKSNQPFAAGGKNLFAFDFEKSYTLVSDIVDYWITPNYIYAFEKRSLKNTFYYDSLKEVLTTNSKLQLLDQKKFRSYYQTTFNAILSNKILPLN